MRSPRDMITRNGRVLAITATIILVLSGLTLVVAARLHPPQSRPPGPAPTEAQVARPDPSPVTGGRAVGPVLPASAPMSIAIPAIGVRSPLLRLGLTPEGTMAVPQPGPHYDEAGWFKYSPTPGSLGPAVIVGHVDSATERSSIFFRLGSLHKHDRVLVRRADHTVAIFEVDGVRSFRKTRFPTKLVYGNTDHAALRLITCGGPLEAGHYRDNVVVLASLVGSRAATPTTG